jgi:hypothetical protein
MSFGIGTIATVAALMLLGVKLNRNDRHPILGAFLWICALTLLVWGLMIWHWH